MCHQNAELRQQIYDIQSQTEEIVRATQETQELIGLRESDNTALRDEVHRI